MSLKVLRASLPSTNQDNHQLNLPSSFGTIYQGEQFKGIISQQESKTQLIVELENPHHLKTTLSSSDSEQLLINHHITQIGLHSLICTFTYQDNEEPRSFRKLYKFTVLNPLTIKSKIYRHPNNDNLLADSLKKTLCESQLTNPFKALVHNQHEHPNHLEIQLQNLASKPLLNLSLNILTHSSTQIGQTASNSILQPGDIQQYLFKISEHDIPKEIEVKWTSLMGEPGRLTRSIGAIEPINESTPIPSSVTVDSHSLQHHGLSEQNAFFKAQILGLPSTPIIVGAPFAIQLRISYVPQTDPEAEQALYHLLHTHLADLRIQNTNPHLLLLSPQPLNPASTPAPSELLFDLQFLPLSLPQPPASPLLLGQLSTDKPHVDRLFGFASEHISMPLGSVLVHNS